MRNVLLASCLAAALSIANGSVLAQKYTAQLNDFNVKINSLSPEDMDVLRYYERQAGYQWRAPISFNESALTEEAIRIFVRDADIVAKRVDKEGVGVAWKGIITDKNNQNEIGEVRIYSASDDTLLPLYEPGQNNAIKPIRSAQASRLVAVVDIPGVVYKIIKIPSGNYYLLKYDHSNLPSEVLDDVLCRTCATSILPEVGVLSDEQTQTLAVTNTEIKVLFSLNNAYGDPDYPEISANLIDAINKSNSAFKASGVGVTIKSLGIAGSSPDYASLSTILSNMKPGRSGPYSFAFGVRDTVGGDILIHLSKLNSDTRCGLAPQVGSTKATAYATVRNYCFAQYSLPHEIGHLLGGDHQPSAGASYSKPYAHPTLTPGTSAKKGWTTIMYSGSPANTVRIPRISTPLVKWSDGKPLGNKDTADNARRFNETKATVGAYYP